MRKIAILVLSLILCLSVLPLTVFAQEDNFTLTLHVGDTLHQTNTGSSSYVLPPFSTTGKVLAGWYAPATEGKAAVFLPVGATVTKEIATELTALFISMVTRADAELRLTAGDEGLRFVTDINRADMETLSAYATVLSMGTLIARKNTLPSSENALTHGEIEKNGTKHLDVVTAGAYTESRYTYTIAGSVSQIPKNKIYTDFLGVGYLKVSYTDGSEGYVYADFSTEGQTKVYPLAVNAFGDRSAAQDDTYAHKSSSGYSPYTATELAFMKDILDSVINLSFDANGNPVIHPNIEAYEAPFTVTGTKKDEFERFYLTVKEGSDYRFDSNFHVLLDNGIVRHIYNGSTSKWFRILPGSAGKLMEIDFTGL